MTPAERIVQKFGGRDAFREKYKISESRLYRWTAPAAKGGTGGRVPSKHQQKLLDLARAENVDLKPEDFFEVEQ